MFERFAIAMHKVSFGDSVLIQAEKFEHMESRDDNLFLTILPGWTSQLLNIQLVLAFAATKNIDDVIL